MEKKQNPEIVRTEDGSDTLYIHGIDEHYHSIHGAIQESEHIFINSGFDFVKGHNIRIFEAGFGTGLNAILTLIRNSDTGKVTYTTIENNPLPLELITKLNYTDLIPSQYRNFFREIHECGWDSVINITDRFSLLKINGDLTTYPLAGEYDLIYFDAFGPDKQPEMWTEEILGKISSVASQNSIFVTYSAKGSVRRILCRNGFDVSPLPGPPGKRHIIRAVKI